MEKLSSSGNMVPTSLIATAIVGLLAVLSFVMVPREVNVVADMYISPSSKTLTVGETFTVDIMVEAQVPVNVFAGDLQFDTQRLHVESIDYNTSIADLWAEEPWYSNGDGTLTFAGGTTQKGGFEGTASLIKITFRTLGTGTGALVITNAEVLQHDGLGSNAELAAPIDAIFTVEETAPAHTNLIQKSALPSTYAVVETPPTTDLNNDGKQSIADTSIFLMHLGSGDLRFDFNRDGAVNLKDFNIILGGG